MIGKFLSVLNLCGVTMDLSAGAVELVLRKERRMLVYQFDHGSALVGHVADDPDRITVHLQKALAIVATLALQQSRFDGGKALALDLQQLFTNIIECLEELSDQPERACNPD